ncbi:MAG: hypothetical protein JEZ09_13030 [Salinivirgaceae bacterium]|nr:hypothetical protein [Salinivirgaceae bacterium]
MKKIKEIREYLLANLGLNFNDNQEKELYRKLSDASLKFNFDNTDSFIDWLLMHPLDNEQIEKLASFLTIGETYFFREKKALDYLEFEYLPRLIKTRNASNRHLKIWSAGCASGEEPYSIAILLKRIIPDLKDWDITILATDINSVFLEKARKGIYTKWSFRGMPESFKTKYFKQDENNNYHINQSVKNMVDFSYLNIASDSYPSATNKTDKVDIILCRNVLIYFSADGIKNVTSKLYESLVNDGVLLVSPVEVSPIISQKFNNFVYKGFTIYNKGPKNDIEEKQIQIPDKLIEKSRDNNKPLISDSKKLEKNDSVSLPVNKLVPGKPKQIVAPKKAQEKPVDYKKLLELYQAGKFDEVETLIESAITGINNNNITYILLLARIKANKGKLDESEKLCMQAVNLDKINEDAHYLMASVFSEQGKLKEAKDSINRVLFLKPEFALGHFMLGNMALSNGAKPESKKHFNNAVLCLNKFKPDEIIAESDGLTAGNLLQIIKTMVL